MIEEGYIQNEISDKIIRNYLSDPMFDGIEALLLACTHYPLIRRQIEAFFEGKVQVLDSTQVVAEAVAKTLGEQQLLSPQLSQPHHFYVSDYTPSFEATTRFFYKEEVMLEHLPIW